MLPNAHIEKIMMLTNRPLSIFKKPDTTIGEILNVFGVLIITTEFEFG